MPWNQRSDATPFMTRRVSSNCSLSRSWEAMVRNVPAALALILTFSPKLHFPKDLPVPVINTVECSVKPIRPTRRRIHLPLLPPSIGTRPCRDLGQCHIRHFRIAESSPWKQRILNSRVNDADPGLGKGSNAAASNQPRADRFLHSRSYFSIDPPPTRCWSRKRANQGCRE